MHRWLAFVLICISLLSIAARPLQTNVEILDAAVFYTYAQQATFQARVQASEPIQHVYLFIQAEGQPTRVAEPPISPQGEILLSIHLVDLPLRPFVRVNYWYKLSTSTNGQEFTSPTYSFVYEDNRLPWQTLADENFTVNWLQGDAAFGQNLLNTANAALQQIQSIQPAQPAKAMRIYVYSSPQDLQSALSLSSEPWVAGHASPDLGVMVLSITPTPDSGYEMERQIPHELSHILLYQLTGAAYPNIPTWLNEGLASKAELYPNPDYARALQRAVQNNSLLSFNSLCSGFPRDASGAFLSYAQSASFINFLNERYGTSGLQNLIQQYRDGKSCETAIQAAFGVSLAQLETRWQQETLGLNIADLVWERLRPYVFLGLLILLPSLLVGLAFRFKHS